MNTNHEPPPNCPVCGGGNLAKNLWSLDGGEVEALECDDCHAGAPLESWNKRANPWIDYEQQQPEDGQKILYWYSIDADDVWSVRTLKHGSILLVGPMSGRYQKEYQENGVLRPIVYWQPIADIPKPKAPG